MTRTRRSSPARCRSHNAGNAWSRPRVRAQECSNRPHWRYWTFLIRPDVRVLHSRGMPAALLSVVVPVFNRRELVLRAIGSVLAQEGASDREIIVVDDGSTDGTADAIARRFGGDARVRTVAAHHAGASAARNLGL